MVYLFLKYTSKILRSEFPSTRIGVVNTTLIFRARCSEMNEVELVVLWWISETLFNKQNNLIKIN
jgi:hypothetical protein